jgi:hypothetical protein
MHKLWNTTDGFFFFNFAILIPHQYIAVPKKLKKIEKQIMQVLTFSCYKVMTDVRT